MRNNITKAAHQWDRREFRKGPDGLWRISIRGMARMMDVRDTGIGRHFKGAHQNPSELAKSLLAQGFCPAHMEGWGKEGIPEQAVPVILGYYAYEARDKSEVAKRLYQAFAAVGIHAYLDEVLGEPSQRPALDPPRILDDPVDARRQVADHEKGIYRVVVPDEDELTRGYPSHLVSMAKVGVTQGLNRTTPKALNKRVQEETGLRSINANDAGDPLQTSLRSIALYNTCVVLQTPSVRQKITPQQIRELGEDNGSSMTRIARVLDPSRVVRQGFRGPEYVDFRYTEGNKIMRADKAKREQEKRKALAADPNVQQAIPGL